MKSNIPKYIQVRGAKVNELKNINVDIPLNSFVVISGLSGSGKSSLAMDVLYAEGSRRYLETLSTYTRRRISQEEKPNVEAVNFLPAAVALKQRPQTPNIRSTVGTLTEGFNILRLIFSRLGSHVSPKGVRVSPSLNVAKELPLATPDGEVFNPPSAEDFAFNGAGACPTCQGLGRIRQINKEKLVPNEDLSIDQGAVASWGLPGRNFMKYVVVAMGIDIHKPFKDLSEQEKNEILFGEKKAYTINIPTSTGRVFHMENAIFENAYVSVEDSYNTTTNEKTIKRLNKFYSFDVCSSCHGSRFKSSILESFLVDRNIADVCNMELADLPDFAQQIVKWLPEEMKLIGNSLVEELVKNVNPLIEMGLDYLTFARGGDHLSTGELQRIHLHKTVKNATTGMLYVLDEPSIGLHPANIEGLITVFQEILMNGNSLVVVDHNINVIKYADIIIEMGPGAGIYGGNVINTASVENISKDENSLIGPFLSGKAQLILHNRSNDTSKKDKGNIDLSIKKINNLEDVTVSIPLGKHTVVTGVSGSGKSTVIIDCLVPAIQSVLSKEALPSHINFIKEQGIKKMVYIDASPIGKNARSTVATFSGVFDFIRTYFANTDEAKKRKWTKDYFSYNSPQGACPSCKGKGFVSLDVQYLPDIEDICPVCEGKRYQSEILEVKWKNKNIAEILDLSIADALIFFQDETLVFPTIKMLHEVGLDYLKLGQSTPRFSGGEAQRLKLSSEMGTIQKGTLFIFDEPTIGLHPKDVQTLIGIFDHLILNGATIIDIEHDLTMIANADYVIDVGPGGGKRGGKIVAQAPPLELASSEVSVTGKYLKAFLKQFGVS